MQHKLVKGLLPAGGACRHAAELSTGLLLHRRHSHALAQQPLLSFRLKWQDESSGICSFSLVGASTNQCPGRSAACSHVRQHQATWSRH